MLTINNTIDGAIQDIEIKGNTVQNPDNLADIKSVGELQEDGTYKMSISSCGKNLFNPFSSSYEYSLTNGLTKVGHTTNEDGSITVSSKGSYDWGFVEYQNITVPKDITMSFIPNGVVTKGNASIWIFEANGTKICEGANTRISFISTTGKINVRLYVQTTTSYSDAKITYKPYLTEGTVATEYEPYQGNKCDILLPCQLEKVGNVSDRLYYDDVEKAWCIEKNVETIILNGSETWLKYPNWDTINTMLFYLDYNAYKVYNKHVAKKEYTECKSNLFNYSPRTDFVNLADKEKIIMYGAHTGADINITTCSPQISILKSKLPTQDVTGFKTWLSQNPTLVKYQLTTPQKIVLPLSTQIALNSFFGTTHVYMESGEVEGIIKCKIPKSIGATVQSLNNKTDILSDRIEAIEGLKDSQNMKYETDKGYLVCKETKNGVIDDLKIEGKTLVNRTDIFNKVNPTGGGAHRKTSNSLIVDYNKCGELDNSYSLDEINVFKSGRIYTIIIDIIQNTLNQKVEFYPMIWDFATVISGTQDVNTGEIGRKIFVIKANKDYALKLGYASPSQATQGVTGLVEFKDIMVLDGDYTNIELPNYFEGLMSVGQDVDEIEVLSSNGNMFDIGNSILNDKTRIEDGVIYTTNVANANGYFIVDIPLDNPIITFKLHSNSGSVNDWWAFNFKDYVTNKDNFINAPLSNVGNVITKQTSLSKGKYKVYMGANTNTSLSLGLKDVTIGYSIKTISSYKQDKKQILFYNENGELEPIQELHEWDSIEKHSDNKWYYHKRSGKVVLNGSEEFYMIDVNDKPNTLLFHTDANFIPSANVIKDSICDKLALNKTISGVDVESHLVAETSRIYIRLLKSKLSTQDVQGFKQWLQTNNVTVVYQLAEEEVYEIAPLHLDSYANETLILCNSGAISPKMEFSITSHINELVKAYGERINLLEEKVYQYMVAQNRLQLASTYSADSVTFKVDYFSLCGDEENYDEDLYNLILNNILVGKDNYDYDKMFTMILDYASWNQISWEQFDILVGLMDMQHNPPIEELPPEDVIEEDIIENETPVE